MGIVENLTSKKFGMLTVLEYAGKKKSKCICECGNCKIILTSNLKRGYAKSCGCLRKCIRKTYLQDIKNNILNSIYICEKGCWNWIRAKHRQGYGNLSFGGKVHLAHRISWKVFKGEIDSKMKVLHKCDNTACVNPDHLFIGTQRDNIKDMFLKNRSKRQKLTQQDVIEIKLMYSKNIDRIEIAKKYKISLSNLCFILNNVTWKD